MKFLFTGGGTGGHVYPALAVARKLAADPRHELLYIGTRGRAEELILDSGTPGAAASSGPESDAVARSIPIVYARSRAFPGRRPLPLLLFIAGLGMGVLQAAWRILRFRPHLVFATGGYASAPAVFAAWLLRRLLLSRARILLHEQNAFPGLMNRVGARLADLTALTFREAGEHLPAGLTVHSGYPVRGDLRELPDRETAWRALDLDPNRPVLFVFGGSQGARSINRALYEILPELLSGGVQVLHAYGTMRSPGYDAEVEHRRALERIKGSAEDGATTLGGRLEMQYRAWPFLFDISGAYAAADLVLCRAGAGTLFEVLNCGLAAVLVPKMGLPGDHQVANARRIQEARAARLVLEEPVLQAGRISEAVNAAELAGLLRELLNDPVELAEMRVRARELARPAALEGLCELALALAGRKDPAEAAAALEGGSRRNRRTEMSPDDTDLGQGAERLAALETAGEERLLSLVDNGERSDPESRSYIEYRCCSALAAADWARRNRGVKLAGSLKLERSLPLLLHLAADRRPPALFKRLFGERSRQNGFIRRNLATTLGRIGRPTPEVHAALRTFLDDPYWEVRVEAMRALARLGFDAEGWEDLRIRGFLKRGNFEEVQAALEWWGAAGRPAQWREILLPQLAHANARVRDGAVRTLIGLLRERRIGSEEVRPVLDDIIVTSTCFTPQFPLRKSMQDLGRAMARETWQSRRGAARGPAEEREASREEDPC